MLKELAVKSFALIDDLKVEFGEGLNVITGETGAGKSIVLDAINILCGKRVTNKIVRDGEEKCIIKGYFNISKETIRRIVELDLIDEVEKDLFLMREIKKDGANRCKINGELVPLKQYQLLGKLLFEIHGQNQEQEILSRHKQLSLVDSYLPKEGIELLDRIGEVYLELNKISDSLENLKSLNNNNNDHISYLDYCIKEIDKCQMKEGEYEELIEARKKYMNSEKVVKSLFEIYETLLGNEGAIINFNSILNKMDELNNLDDDFKDLKELGYSISANLELYSESLKVAQEKYDLNESDLEVSELRLDELRIVKRKYGSSFAEVTKKREQMARELEKIENIDESIIELENKLKEIEIIYLELGNNLSKKRKEAALLIQNSIRKELEELGIFSNAFSIKIVTCEKRSKIGFNECSILFSPNRGEEPNELKNYASGGEISRIMLAIKGVIARKDSVDSLVFDEIDTGIGGESIIKIGQSLGKLGEAKQVICVTHSPIIASFGTYHNRIYKEFINGRTMIRIECLNNDELRIGELARMLGGEKNISTSIIQGKEMLRFARKGKKV